MPTARSDTRLTKVERVVIEEVAEETVVLEMSKNDAILLMAYLANANGYDKGSPKRGRMRKLLTDSEDSIVCALAEATGGNFYNIHNYGQMFQIPDKPIIKVWKGPLKGDCFDTDLRPVDSNLQS